MYGAENNAGSDRLNLDGKMRDIRFYTYALSAEQVASLYSGTYPVIPVIAAWILLI